MVVLMLIQTVMAFLDKDDDCVNTPGPKSNNGCPVIRGGRARNFKHCF